MAEVKAYLIHFSDLSLRAEGMNSVFEDVENTVVNNWWFSEVPNLIKSEQKLHTETRKRLEGMFNHSHPQPDNLTGFLFYLENLEK